MSLQANESYFAEDQTATKTQIGLRSSQAKACGKSIIVGEHAAVYGALAVAMPLSEHGMNIRLTPRLDTKEIRLILEGRELSNHLCAVVEDGFKALGVRPFGLSIEGTRSLPLGAGLGSSATLCVVVLRALSQAYGVKIAPEELAKLGNELEKRFHGNPSGLDTAVVAFEQVIAFRKGEVPRRIHLSPKLTNKKPWRFLLIDSGVRSSTMTMIKIAKPFFKSPMGDRRLGIFEKLGQDAVDALTTGEAAGLADSMNHANAMLAQAGIVNEQLKNIIEQCQAEGVLSAKPTGAGGGGSVLVFLDQEKATEQVQNLRESLSPLKMFEVELP